jgi:hypothetical protein
MQTSRIDIHGMDGARRRLSPSRRGGDPLPAVAYTVAIGSVGAQRSVAG